MRFSYFVTLLFFAILCLAAMHILCVRFSVPMQRFLNIHPCTPRTPTLKSSPLPSRTTSTISSKPTWMSPRRLTTTCLTKVRRSLPSS